MELGLFEIKEITINRSDGGIDLKRTTKVTGRGQLFFLNKFLGGRPALDAGKDRAKIAKWRAGE
jgi:phage antirepressor YoqD-like protein